MAAPPTCTASARRRRDIAGKELAIVFQDALTALNPVYTVGTQLAEPFRIHRGLSKKAAREEAIELMRRVGIPEPETRIDSYPHQFSGGMRQRLLIAMAWRCRRPCCSPTSRPPRSTSRSRPRS